MSKNLELMNMDIPFGYINSPVAQASMWGIDYAYEWQKAIWLACWKAWSNVVCLTCNESGKTRVVVPVLALSWAAAFPGSTVVITSKSEDQITQQLWPSLKNMAKVANWDVSGSEITAPVVVPHVPGSKIYTRVTKEGTRFEGYHNNLWPTRDGDKIVGPLLIIADEAKSISDDIFDAIERCNPCVRLYISSTGDDSGALWDSWNDESGIWTKSYKLNDVHHEFKIPWTKCPHLYENPDIREKKEALIKQRGHNDPFVCSNLLAEFFRGGTYMCFESSDLQKVQECMSGMREKMSGHRIAFCDLSSGGDELTFGLREGNYIHPFIAWHHDGTVAPEDTARRYIKLFNQYKLRPSEISADSGGVGKEIINQLHKMGWPIKRITSNNAPKDKASFVDRYTEAHWELKSILQQNVLILPRDQKLLNQMRLRRFVRKNSDENKIKTESKEDSRKKRGEDSPDRLDTLIYLCENLEPYKVEENLTFKNRCPTVKDFFDSIKNGENDNEHSIKDSMPTFY